MNHSFSTKFDTRWDSCVMEIPAAFEFPPLRVMLCGVKRDAQTM